MIEGSEAGSSELANEQVANHLTSSDPNSDAESGEIERGAKHVSKTERKHRRNPTLSELESPASILGHHVLLDRSATQVVNRTGRVVLSLERSSGESVLVAGKDVEVVIRLQESNKIVKELIHVSDTFLVCLVRSAILTV